MQPARFIVAIVLGLVAHTVWAAGVALDMVQIPSGDFVTLCLHDVRDNVAPEVDRDRDAISTRRLAQLFDWMHEHGWHPVSVDQIVAAHESGPALPSNAVLLSFDDGLESMYSRVYPLLRAFGYPAVSALETGWLRRVHQGSQIAYRNEGPLDKSTKDKSAAAVSANLKKPGKVLYNGRERGAAGFLTWAQIREMQHSGLVEFGVHTDDLHHGLLANPQGNKEPAAITRLYHLKTGRYETHAEFRRRVRDDLARCIKIIRQHTGHIPRLMIWPYGAMTPEVEAIARNLGLKISFGLGDDHVSSIRQIKSLGRFLVTNDPEPTVVAAQVDRALHPPKRIKRAVQIDLDDVYDPDPKQVNTNLGALLDRIKALHVRTVYLQAFADPDGDGTASALYFPNHYLPMRADLFNRVAWQLKTRAGVQVYAWLPLLAFDLPGRANSHALAVKIRSPDGSLRPSGHDYRRLSPFLPKALRIVSGIYEDLAQNTASINGVLIHDDAYLTGDEDASSCEAQARWPGSGRSIAHCQLSARDKTRALIAFSHAAVNRMRRYINVSDSFYVARNLYARVVLDPSAETRFAQALGPFLRQYDDVVLMAMPYLDGTDMPADRWLAKLEKRVAARPGALNKVVFELQARNWRAQTWIAGTTLRHWMRELVRRGALNLAYYPDDFLANEPSFKPTYEGISLNTFPHRSNKR